MNLYFLTNREATIELSSSEYLQKMSKSELVTRLNPFYPKDKLSSSTTKDLFGLLYNLYLNSFQDFDSLEQSALELYFSKIKDQLEADKFYLPDRVTISLIKLNDHQRKLDWGYLYTLNSSIIIPTSYLETLVTRYHQMNQSISDTLGPASSGLPAQADINLMLQGMGDLYHEVVHILQRTVANHHPFFETMYRQFFGFKKAKIRGQKQLQKQVTLITNPDALNFEWITTITVNGRYQPVSPTLIYNQSSDKLEEVLFFLDKDCSPNTYVLNGQFSKPDNNYRNRFLGMTRQLHHPNEISAHLLSDYLILGKMWGLDWASFPFYQYVDAAKRRETSTFS